MANLHHAVRISLMVAPIDALFLKLSVTFDGLYNDIKFFSITFALEATHVVAMALYMRT